MNSSGNQSKAEYLRKKAEELLKKKPLKSVSKHSETKNLKLINELEVHKIELELQNEELMLARSAAQDAAGKYMELYDFAPSGHYTLSRKGKIIELNFAGSQMLGKEREQLINNQFGFFVSDDTKRIFNLFLTKIFDNKAKESCQVTLDLEGNPPILVNIEGIATENGKQCLITIIDITELRQVETALKLSEEKFRILYDNAPVGLYRTTPDGRILLSNQALVEMLGYSTFGELSNRNLEDTGFEPLYDRKQFIDQIEKNGEVKDLEAKWICHNGTVIIVKESAKAIRDSKGNILYYDGTVEDITKRKQLENRINFSSKIQNLLNNITPLDETIKLILDLIQAETGFEAAGIRFRKGEDYPYYIHNGFDDEFLKTENTLFEYTKEGVICRDQNGKPWLECICGLVISGKVNHANPLFTKRGSFWTNFSPDLLNLSIDDKPRYNPRNRCIHKGYLSIALIPVRANGEIVGLLQINDRKKDCFTLEMIQFFESISEIIGIALMRKQAEEAMKESEMKYRLLFNNASQSIFVAQDGKLQFANPKTSELVGYSIDELLSIPFSDLIYPDDRKMVIDNHQRRLKGEPIPNSYHFRILRKDKTFRWVEISAVSFEWQGKVATLNFLSDITIRKQAQQTLQDKVNELEIFNSLMVDREIKMVELKKEINELLKKEGKDEKYEIFE